MDFPAAPNGIALCATLYGKKHRKGAMTIGKRRALIWVGSVFRHCRDRAGDFHCDARSEQSEEIHFGRSQQGHGPATEHQRRSQPRSRLDLQIERERDTIRRTRTGANTRRWPKSGSSTLKSISGNSFAHFRLVLPTVTISQPKVVLEKNAEGLANWEFRAAPAMTAPVPEKRSEFPVIEKLIIKDGMLLFDDQESKTQTDLKVIEAEAAGFLDAPVKLKAEGTYQKLPLTLSLDGGSYENLRSSKEPYPLQINLVRRKAQSKNRRQSDRAIGDERRRRHTRYSRRRHGESLPAHPPRLSKNAALPAQRSFKARRESLVILKFFRTRGR